jgi:SEFIR domain
VAVMLQQVFISYRHETPEHERAVGRLGELLRHAKIPVVLDQFFKEDNPGGPDEGWPKWSEDRANESACLLIVASEGWFAAYNKTAPPDTGMGAATEADLVRQWLYDEKADNTRIRLVLLHEIAADKIPPRLRGWHQFRPFESDDQLEGLLRWVAQCVGVENPELPAVRWPEPVPFRPDFADRVKEEWPAVAELLTSHSRHRILLYEGASGLGKSVLVRQAAAYAKKLGVGVALVDFKGGPRDVLGIWVSCIWRSAISCLTFPARGPTNHICSGETSESCDNPY